MDELDRAVGVVVAGSAGMKIRYAASLLARAGIISGLAAAQQDDAVVVKCTGVTTFRISRDTIKHFFQPVLNDEVLAFNRRSGAQTWSAALMSSATQTSRRPRSARPTTAPWANWRW